MVVQVAVHATDNLRRLGTERRTTSLQEYDDRDLAGRGIGEGSEPSESGAGVGAGSGLAEHFFFAEVPAHALCGSVPNGRGHSRRNLGDQRPNVEIALD